MFIIKLQKIQFNSIQLNKKMMKILKQFIQRSLENMNTSNVKNIKASRPTY